MDSWLNSDTFRPPGLVCRSKNDQINIAIFAYCHCHLPFLASLKMAIFDLQTSAGGLKVSEFNQESVSEVLSSE